MNKSLLLAIADHKPLALSPMQTVLRIRNGYFIIISFSRRSSPGCSIAIVRGTNSCEGQSASYNTLYTKFLLSWHTAEWLEVWN